MRVYMLNPPFIPGFVRCGRWQGATARSGGLDYPKWLAYATGLLELDGHKVKLSDAPAENKNKSYIIEEALRFRPDLVVIETNFSSLMNDIDVAKIVGKETGAQTIVVGPPSNKYDKIILCNSEIDYVARMEYDFTIMEMARNIETGSSLRNLKGISFYENGKYFRNPDRELSTSSDIDNIPFVSKIYKKHLNIKNYFLSQSLYPEVQIFAGRGCPYKCTFCSWPENLMGRKIRIRSPSNLADEFEWIQSNMPKVKEIFLEDDTFTINKNIVKDFCSEIKKRDIKIVWSCNSRANMDYSTMKSMKDAGCRLMIVGYESGNDEILKRIRKGITTKQMRKFTEDAKKARILIHADFIIGLPGENEESSKRTLRFIKEIKPNYIQVAVATPIPGTDFFEWAKKMGFLLTEDLTESIDSNGFQKCIISYPDFDKSKIETFVDQSLREYYLSPSYIPIAMANIFRKNGGIHELNSILTSAKVFLLKYIHRNNGEIKAR